MCCRSSCHKAVVLVAENLTGRFHHVATIFSDKVYTGIKGRFPFPGGVCSPSGEFVISQLKDKLRLSIKTEVHA